jgi:hypothetical protein
MRLGFRGSTSTARASAKSGRCAFSKDGFASCTDDADSRCTARPGDCAFVALVGRFLGSSRADLCDRILKNLHLPSNYLPTVPTQVFGAATANSVGFPLHLAAVQLLLARTAGVHDTDLDLAGEALARRQPLNPFFQYLANGSSSNVVALLLSECPSVKVPSVGRSEWAWERDQRDRKWLNSMYWDCIFLGNLL